MPDITVTIKVKYDQPYDRFDLEGLKFGIRDGIERAIGNGLLTAGYVEATVDEYRVFVEAPYDVYDEDEDERERVNRLEENEFDDIRNAELED